MKSVLSSFVLLVLGYSESVWAIRVNGGITRDLRYGDRNVPITFNNGWGEDRPKHKKGDPWWEPYKDSGDYW